MVALKLGFVCGLLWLQYTLDFDYFNWCWLCMSILMESLSVGLAKLLLMVALCVGLIVPEFQIL